ncbi:AAA family ATPase [Aureibacter tunicatorum]|uniref:Exonuclease SbcC n=1 Tax=Aureibacter tunicatorum TaxID=866807 RepID=A0AAE3XNQ6_9BACT|nr:AAA family ATPase [Aureibacter tunicatorum]MDR6240317.1 exonuclease SbcC [Aureibacter tunicatorum]BDD05802.1 nuclease SbcCD subunit C [Aureibacter tunicatorum]
MKINRIFIKNINSLKGKHLVDFNEGSLAQSELVAIVGPTGAGKSTLLDAILLAFYNKTPRYQKVSANELEKSGGLVTRGESEAISSVDFEVVKDGKASHYRAHWTASKGQRGEAKNEIRNYRMEFSELKYSGDDQGVILAEGRENKVVPVIEDIVGLHYDQFVKAVMLSQGEFAKLLKADRKQRNQLLEKVTRSFDFRDISIKAYQAYDQRKKELEELYKDKERINVLSIEEKEEIEKKLLEYTEQLDKEALVLSKYKKTKDNFDNFDKILEELSALESKENKLKEELQTFEPKKISLELFESALPLQADWKSLNDQKVALKNLNQEKEKLDQSLQSFEDQWNVLNQNQKMTDQSLLEWTHKKDMLETLWKSVEGYDKEIDKFNAEAESFAVRLKDTSEKKKETESKKAQSQQQLQELDKNQTQLTEWLKEKASLESLSSELGKLESAQAQSLEYKSHFDQEVSGIEDQSLLKRVKIILNDSQFTDHLDNWKFKTESELNEAKGQRIFNDWDIEKYTEAEILLEKASDHYQNIAKLSQQKKEALERKTSLDKELKQIDKEVEAQRIAIQHTELSETELKAKVERLKLENNKSVLGLRKSLQKGQPCAVCGSLDHPFEHKEDQIDETKQAEKQLEEINKYLKKLTVELQSFEKKKVAGQTSLKAVDMEISKAEKDLIALNNEKTNYDNKFKYLFSEIPHNLFTQLELIKQDKKLVERIEKYSKFLLVFDRIQQSYKRWQASQESFKSLFAPYQAFSADINELKLLSEDYTLKKDKADQLNNDIKLAENDLTNLNTAFDQVNVEYHQVDAQYQVAKEQSKGFKNAREALFGDKKVEAERENYQQEKDIRTKAVTEVKEALVKNQTEKENQTTNLQKTVSQIEQMEQDIQEKQLNLLARSVEKGFETLEDLQQALELKNIEELKAENKQLEVNKSQISGAKVNILERKEKLEEIVFLEPLDKEENQRRLAETELRIDEVKDKVASEKAELNHSAKNEKEAEKLLKSISKKEEELKTWICLNDMIGSASGDKFNDYAQSLMLGILLEYANKHLDSLSPRYRFVTVHSKKEGEKIDDLFVKDMEMGEDIRAIRTLSGGETFLLSLSLALGLSEMASQRIQIESLFIDEGFGTLDKDTLEEALSTLETLQNTTNKKIMIISHVPELQERIPTQIRLHKTGNGYSKIITD